MSDGVVGQNVLIIQFYHKSGVLFRQRVPLDPGLIYAVEEEFGPEGIRNYLNAAAKLAIDECVKWAEDHPKDSALWPEEKAKEEP